MKLENAIILSGNLGSGKSTVSSLLEMQGFFIIDADKVAHEVLQNEAETIMRDFGDEFVKDGIVDRKKLGKLVFSDINKRKKLENLLHPKIRDEIYKKASFQEKFKQPYIIDIPLYFESENSYEARYILLVYTPLEICFKRLQKRDNLSDEEIQKRQNSQMDIELKRQKSDFVIENTQDLKHLQNEVRNFLEWLRRDYESIKI